MNIQYLAFSCFKIGTKDADIIIDPYSKRSGLVSPRGGVDIVVLTNKHNDLTSYTDGLNEGFFLVNDPGEYDLKGVTIAGIPTKQGDTWSSIYMIEAEGIKILTLGACEQFNIKDEDIESLGDIDILLLPVGGHNVMDASSAAKAVQIIEPKIVIPSCYAMPSLSAKLDDKDIFIKEMGGKFDSIEKLNIKKKDLTNDEIKLVVLESVK